MIFGNSNTDVIIKQNHILKISIKKLKIKLNKCIVYLVGGISIHRESIPTDLRDHGNLTARPQVGYSIRTEGMKTK